MMFNLKENKFRILYISILLLFLILFVYKNLPKEEIKNPEAYLSSFAVNSFSAVNRDAEKNKPLYDVSEIKTRKQKEKFDKSFGKELSSLLSSPLIPISVNKMVINYEAPIDKGKYSENKMTIATTNSSGTLVYFLAPKDIKFPAPLIIAMHQRGDTKYGSAEAIGNIGDETMFYGKELAERGYFVFAMDTSTFGMRQDIINDSHEVRENRAAQDLFELGYSPIGITINEDIRALDFLLNSFPEIDKNNIGCIGHSYGGVRCMYLAAIDKRIKVAVLSNSIENFREPPSFGGTQTWLSILPGIAKYTNGDAVLALISPRPLMIIYTENDPIFPKDFIEKQIFKPITDLYKTLEKEENLKIGLIPNKAHEFPLEYHEQAYQFLDKHLKTNS